MPDRDDDLRRVVRHAAAPGRVPPFGRLWAAAKRRPATSARRWPWIAAAAAAAAVGLVVLVRSPEPPLRARPVLPTPNPVVVPAEVVALTHWQGPLDVLLDTPGVDVLSAGPAIGTLPAWASTSWMTERRETDDEQPIRKNN